MIDIQEYYLEKQYRNSSYSMLKCQVEWINRLRESSFKQFLETGFPSQLDEDWRYTSIIPITNKLFKKKGNIAHRTDDDQCHFNINNLNKYRIVFVDGLYDTSFSSKILCKGLRINTLKNVLETRPESIKPYFGSTMVKNQHGFTAMNNAFSENGAIIELDANYHIDQPIELLFINSGNHYLSQPRNLIIANFDSSAKIIERYVSSKVGYDLTNSTTEIILSKKSEIDYYLIQTPSKDAYHISGIWVKQETKSRFSCRTVTLGGAIVRNDIRTEMIGTKAHCDMFGLYHLGGKQHVDNHTNVIHKATDCTSYELYKGILNDHSRGVFHGMIRVDQGAQKTDATQHNNTLLLSEDAEIDTQPQLEIYADNVKCSHGATVGDIDNSSLFYLRSRGINESAARSMLTLAFYHDIFQTIEIGAIKDELTKKITQFCAYD